VVGVGFDLSLASYTSVSFDVSGQDGSPQGIVFNNDGTKLYMVGNGGDSVYQYSLSTAFDLSTASYDSVSFDVSGQASSSTGIAFNNDGTKMYIVGFSGDSVYQYSLSTDFDLSTASYDSVSLDVSGQDDFPVGIAFNNDGTKLYMVGNGGDSVYQYSLSTAFDLSTASYDSVSFDVSGQDIGPSGMAFNNDGTKLYMVGSVSDSVYQYSLSTAFDLSTASYDSVSFDVSGQDIGPQGIAFNNDGAKLYMVGSSTESVYQYVTGGPQALIFPSSVEFPDSASAARVVLTKTAYEFVTTDTGTSYQCINVTGGIS
jgi:sugar lactone lactonase YvrE